MSDHEIYFVGSLGYARRMDPRVDEMATRYLIRGTPVGVPINEKRGAPVGTGEGVLTQRRVDVGVYEYRFTPYRDRRAARFGSTQRRA